MCQCCNDVVHFLHADRCMPVQVMLMRRRGYGVGTEGRIDLVCYRFVSTALQCYRVMGVKQKIKRESALVAKKEQLNNMYSVKIRGKTLEGSKISADVRWPILNSTASYNLTPPLSECLWGKEETWLCPSIIQYVCVCVLALVCIHVCLCVIWCLVWLGRSPTLLLISPVITTYNGTGSVSPLLHWMEGFKMHSIDLFLAQRCPFCTPLNPPRTRRLYELLSLIIYVWVHVYFHRACLKLGAKRDERGKIKQYWKRACLEIRQ